MPVQNQLPILDHPLDQPAAFTPEALIHAVRTERRLPHTPVPKVCLLDFDGDITDWLASAGLATPWPSWACFHTTMFSFPVGNTAVGVIARTIGGPYAVLVAEQLRVSGAELILGLTSAGRVAPSLPLPSFVIPQTAIRDEGTSYHYLPASPSVPAPPELIEPLRNALLPLGRNVTAGPVWSTDAPYRETHEQLQRHAAMGVLAVEMQAASLFAFASARNFPVGIVAQVTNAVHDERDSFDKGSHDDEHRLIQALARVGVEWVRRNSPR
jgi:uridine phosphorylase